MSLTSLLLDFTSERKCKWEGWFCSILRWFDCKHRRRSLWFWLIKERNILINEKQNSLMRHCSFYQQMKMISGDISFTDSRKYNLENWTSKMKAHSLAVLFDSLIWRSSGIGSTDNSLIDIFGYSHHLSTGYYTDIVRRNSVSVTRGN